MADPVGALHSQLTATAKIRGKGGGLGGSAAGKRGAPPPLLAYDPKQPFVRFVPAKVSEQPKPGARPASSEPDSDADADADADSDADDRDEEDAAAAAPQTASRKHKRKPAPAASAARAEDAADDGPQRKRRRREADVAAETSTNALTAPKRTAATPSASRTPSPVPGIEGEDGDAAELSAGSDEERLIAVRAGRSVLRTLQRALPWSDGAAAPAAAEAWVVCGAWGRLRKCEFANGRKLSAPPSLALVSLGGVVRASGDRSRVTAVVADADGSVVGGVLASASASREEEEEAEGRADAAATVHVLLRRVPR